MESGTPHVVIMVPTYNEVENVEAMLDAFDRVARQTPAYRFSTLVVDDRSPDGTGKIVERYRQDHPGVHLLSRPRQGLGVAMRAGYKHALEKLDADIVVTLDCDFQWDPGDIPRLLQQIDAGADVVIASRHGHAGQLSGWPPGRRLTHWIANTVFARNVAGTRDVGDHNGSFRAIRARGVLDVLSMDHLQVKGYAFFNVMLYEMTKLDVRIQEVPVRFRWRTQGETKVSFSPRYARTFFRDTVEYILWCFRIRLDRMRRRFR